MKSVSIDKMSISFGEGARAVKVLPEVSFSVKAGECFGLVGESGSGKSTLAKALIRLNDAPFSQARAEITGSAKLRLADGVVDLCAVDAGRMRQLRANHVAMVAQDALSGLNPVYNIGAQVAEALSCAQPKLSRAALRDQTLALLEEVGLPDPAQIAKRYPHQLSGGQRQRVMIAMAVSRDPDVLIADEPTTALDVSVQARILQLMKRLQSRSGAATIFITHDLGVVANFADRVAVMYAGQIVELARTADFLRSPRHPYTAGLLASVPGSSRQFPRLKGNAPDPRALPSGCAFRNRCPAATAACETAPPMAQSADRQARCWRVAA